MYHILLFCFFTARQELSKLNEELERKLLQLETERQVYTQREASLKEELEQAKKESRDALLEKEQVEERAESGREEAEKLKVALQARDRQLTEMNEHHAEQVRELLPLQCPCEMYHVMYTQWIYCNSMVLVQCPCTYVVMMHIDNNN